MASQRYIIPGVELGEELGRGAFGRVYQGRHVGLDVPVAVKILDWLGNAAEVQKAVREGRIMARLDHPNIVRIHDTGSVGGAVYHVLEFMDGGSLDAVRHMPDVVLEDVARQMLSALQGLHHARIVHRDVKPSNCLRRSADGRIKLADLGIAASTATLHDAAGAGFAGTLPFMAPELFEGAVASFRSDLYALGMTLACLAMNADPFPTGSIGELIDWSLKGERLSVVKARPDLPFTLSSLIDRLLLRHPEDRPESAAHALSWLDVPATKPPARTSILSAPPAERCIGPWMIGDVLRDGGNWRAFAVSHRATGLAARLVHLQPNGPLKASTDVVLDTASRAAELEHPGVLDVLDYGRWDNRAYVVTAPQGRSLEEVVRSSGPLSEREAVSFVASLSDAVAYLHARNLVFQLVEPGAVNLAADGRTAQLGWPLFCVTAGSLVAGPAGRTQRMTVMAYAAPELFRSSLTIESGVDLYGLGEVLFFLLAGKRAHPGESMGELALSKLGPVPDVRRIATDCTAPTAAVVTRLLDPEPSRRPSAVETRDALLRIARRFPAPSPTTSP